MGSRTPRVGELDAFIAAYEVTKARDAAADWADFLPPHDHPLYQSVLRELVRIDLEAGWDQGQPRRLEDYQRRFPELAQDLEGFREIAFEEYRLRCLAGESPSTREYQERYGITTAGWSLLAADLARVEQWPRASVGAGPRRKGNGVGDPKRWVQPIVRVDAPLGEPDGNGHHGPGDHSDQVPMLGELYGCDPLAAHRLTQAMSQFPSPSSTFLGFQLLAELGRGTFGRVYLARQGDLANRYVALKVAADLYTESQTLAQLQHTHIVPIYSIHQAGPLQAVCMPFLGTTTLADIFNDLRQRDSLPASGKSLVQTLDARKSTTLGARGEGRGAREEKPRPSPLAPRPSPLADDGPRENLHMLARLTHVQAVLWIGARVADGLAHAHARGILHRDLKPANVLLTDEGQPMLLDFNLSADTKRHSNPSAAMLGGTLPYMAPEHLDAYQGADCPVNARSDLYSLGIILYEMLAGRPPYEVPRGPLPEMLARMSAERRQPPPDLRRWNRAVSPAVASIIHHCLEPDPARRYSSAAALREDLECQLAHRPLRHAPEPSWLERAQKYRRRHPRLTSVTSVLMLALLVVLGLGGVLMARSRQLARLEARDSLHQLDEDLKTLRFLVHSPETERQELADAAALCDRMLARYHLPEETSWQDLPASRLLAPTEQQRLREDLGELLVLGAQVNSRQARTATGAQRQDKLDLALRLNQLAETCYAPEARPRALPLQRARLLRWRGRDAEAQDLEAQAKALPAPAARDRYLLLADAAGRGQWRAALPALEEMSRHDPQNYSWWLLLGNCYAALGRLDEAAAYYDLGIALRPNTVWAYFNRGVLYLEHQQYRPAQADFDQVLRLRPDLSSALFNRARARYGLEDYQGALADLTRVVDTGLAPTRVYFFRSRVRARLGDRDGARQDRATGIRLEPVDEKDWIARGVARYTSDPRAALADFDKALELNPNSLAALQNKASVLSEKLDRAAEALAVLDRVVALDPDYLLARAGRGVLLARQGRRAAAHADAQAAQKLSKLPSLMYQLAGIYSLTSRQQPADRQEALRLLSAALAQGYGLNLIAHDPDLDPIRQLPEFQRLVDAAGALRPRAAKVPAGKVP